MNASLELRPRARTRRLSGLVVTIGLASIVVALAATPTLAADNGEPYYGYTVTTSASVSCDAAASTMTVSAQATTFQAQGFYGPTTGKYDAGQWIRYNVFAKELGAADWTQVYTWSSWQWTVSRAPTSTADVTIVAPQNLGSSVVNGSAGHNYEVLVQIDFWTDRENVYNVTPSYSQTLSTDAFNTFYLTPGYCHL